MGAPGMGILRAMESDDGSDTGMWQTLKLLLFGGEPDESPPPAREPAPTRTERLAPAPEPMPDGALRKAPFKRVKRPGGLTGRSHTQAGGGLSPDLAENLKALRKVLGPSGDIIYRTFTIAGANLKAALVYVDGLVENPSINNFILRPLMQRGLHIQRAMKEPPVPPLPVEEGAAAHPFLRRLQQVLVVNSAAMERTVFTHLVDDVLGGATVLLIDTVPAALSLSLRGYEERGVEEPPSEQLVRGPRDGFVESVRINMALLRRKLRDPNLRLELLRVGRRTNTDVALCYIDDIANPKLVEEIRTRINGIDIEGVLESGYLEQIIEDHHFSPFPQIQNTERADRCIANLLEGRVAILVDGTPFCLLLPSVFNQFYQAPEDYYERFLIATLVRAIRVIALFFSLLFTSLYVALISFHSEMLPSRFAVAVAGGRAGVPFPSVAEALFMELAMEILREAGLRLPRPMGQTISIVGALIIGEAAVRAGIVSPLMVIVVALTTIGSFAVPSYSAAIALRIVKFPIILAAGTFGLYGLMLAIIGLVVHLCSLKSLGIPYLSPLAPMRPDDVKDTLYRMPLWSMTHRPRLLRTGDSTRQAHSAGVLGEENLGVEGAVRSDQPKA